MYINRALLLIVAFVVIFFPSIEEWVLSGDANWWRPYLVWLIFIAAAYWNQRSRFLDDI